MKYIGKMTKEGHVRVFYVLPGAILEVIGTKFINNNSTGLVHVICKGFSVESVTAFTSYTLSTFERAAKTFT